MIFVNTRVKCDKIVKMVQVRFERTCADYHGGKNQESRQRIIQDFRNGKFEVLVTTDLGGRGLDIKGVNAVISYDAPKNISEFIHRAGRTGRAGAKGKAFTFLTA